MLCIHIVQENVPERAMKQIWVDTLNASAGILV